MIKTKNCYRLALLLAWFAFISQKTFFDWHFSLLTIITFNKEDGIFFLFLYIKNLEKN